MATMIATKEFKYGTRELTPGDEFDTEMEQHVAVLIAADKAKRKDGTFRKRYNRRDLKADET